MEPKKRIAIDVVLPENSSQCEPWLSILIEAAKEAYLKDDMAIKNGVLKFKK